MKLAILFSSYGPYHTARVAAVRERGAVDGHETDAIALTSKSRDYQWMTNDQPNPVVLCTEGHDADVSIVEASVAWIRYLRSSRPQVVAIAGYWPPIFAVLALIAKLHGVRCLLMHEVHAGTAAQSTLTRNIKRFLLRMFDGAVVGGSLHVRHFQSLGMRANTLLTGYDCIDNQYFSSQVEQVRAKPEFFRERYVLPDAYFLSLGRFVAKKNLKVLIDAYAELVLKNPAVRQHLVLVGSGEEGASLRLRCAQLKLPVVEHEQEAVVPPNLQHAVHFYGFRQIEETPVFFGLADVFVLPSSSEEWGLVVNEAMACALPVVVSQEAGCAPDLLPQLEQELRRRQNGFLFDPRSSTELATDLGFLAMNEGLRKTMGDRSAKIIENFSCQHFGQNLWNAAFDSVRR